MVIVRRRSDGKYYNGARSNSGFSHGEWVDDINECLPYVNERGARSAHTPWRGYCKCKGPMQCNCTEVKRLRAEAKAKFDDRYEIVNVRLEVVQ